MKILTQKDMDDGKKISALFNELSEENKTMVLVYLSALRDKEMANTTRDEHAAK